MSIDWQKPAEPGAVMRTAAVLRRPGALEGGLEKAGGLESLSLSSISPEHRLARLSDALDAASPVVPGIDRGDVKSQVLAGARSGLDKVEKGKPADTFTLAEHVGLESVILANGERPSLIVQGGFVDLAAPSIGTWDFNLARFEEPIRKLTGSVGRVDVPVEPWYAGTCFVAAPGLVVTNRHVLEAIAAQDAAGIWALKWPDATTVNFDGEDGSDPAGGTRFKVVGVAFAGPDPIRSTINFGHLDMAVLRVDPESDKAHDFPPSVTFATDMAEPKARSNLYVLGFPGQPRLWLLGGTPPTGTETMQVISDVFHSKFGIKRLAPGLVVAGPGDVADDARGWVCTHDASSLAGSSGSCVVDLNTDGYRVIGLHFGGANRAQNWAHVLSRLHDVLAKFTA